MGYLDQILNRHVQDSPADVVLAPMSGITDRAFRTVVRRCGAVWLSLKWWPATQC